MRMNQKITFLTFKPKRNLFSYGFRFLAILVCLATSVAQASAENYVAKLDLANTVQSTVTGTITDDNGVPLPGANIIEKGTTNGTQTDFDGNYSLNVGANAVLVVSYIGFVTQEIAVAGRTSISIQLVADAQALSEVVVVGYGTQSRATVSGAISTVGAEELGALPIATAEQALQGRAAGVTVTNAGSPGATPVIRVRGLGTPGDNSPLYVIDGVQTGSLAGINPSDIESINILKDASTTAIYGSQGSNGVIMVTTKKGKAGKTQLNLNMYTGFQTNTERYDVLNTEQYLQYVLDAYNIVPNRPEPGIFNNDTDWQDAIFQTGLMQNYELSASGGNENSRFLFSAGLLDQEGVLIETGFKRYSFRANSDYQIGKLKIGESMSVAFSDRNPERGGGRSKIEHAIKAAPYLPIYNPDNLGGFQGPSQSQDSQDAENAVRSQTLGYQQINTTAIIGSIFAELELIDGLTFKTQVGLDYFTIKDNSFVPSFNDDNLGGTHRQDQANITKNTSEGKTIIFTNSLNYIKTLGDVHNFEFLALAEKYQNDFSNINGFSRNFLSNEIDQLSNTDATLVSGSSETNRQSYLGRLNYNYDSKYIISASLRRDGSSRFGANNRWGTFPSFSGGWNIAKEAFMDDSAFSNLKLRGSWGKVGNDRIPNYQFTSAISTDFLYPQDGVAVVGATGAGLANNNIKWEETTMTNIGLDLGLFNDQITASLEYYVNTSDDLLIGRALPTGLGFANSSFIENVGSVETKGFELTFGYHDYEGDFTWNANLNLGTSTNELKSLGLAQEGFFGGGFEAENISKSSVGEPLFYFFGKVMDGIYQTQAEVDAHLFADAAGVAPGDIRFVDINGDGRVNADDKVKIGNPYPDFTLGLNLDANYKNFDFTMFITGVYGHDVYNTNLYDLVGQPRLFNSGVAVLDRWTPTNPSNTIPRAAGSPVNNQTSTRFMEDGSYTRLKNLSIGYTLPNDIFGDDAMFSKLRLYISGQNLITITDYTGLDPEVANTNNTEFGIDRGNYPQPKSFLLGLQVTF